MERIRRLILNLTPAEVSHIKDYLRLFSGKETKYLQLLETVIANPEISKQEVSNIVFGEWNNKSWLNLSKRLEQKITDFFIAELGLEIMTKDLGENPVKTFELRKKLLGAGVLRRRGHYEIMEDIALYVIKEAEALQLPGFIIEAGRELQAVWDSKKAKKIDFQELSQKIEEACTQYNAIQQNENYYWRIKHLLEKPECFEDAEELFTHMQSFAVIHPRAAFYYHYLGCFIYTQHKPNIILAEPHFDMLHELFGKYDGLAWPYRIGSIYFNRAVLMMNERKFGQALQYFEEANHFFPLERVNFHITQRNIAWLHILIGNLSEAQKILKRLIKKVESFPVLHHPVYLSLFVISFAEKDFTKALKQLNSAIQSAKTTLETAYCKVYEMLINIELSDYESFSKNIDSFRKYIKKYELEDRFFAIYHIFRRLDLHSLDFQMIEFENQHLQMLKNMPLMLRSDMIRLDVWVETKMNQTDYYEVFQQKIS